MTKAKVEEEEVDYCGSLVKLSLGEQSVPVDYSQSGLASIFGPREVVVEDMIVALICKKPTGHQDNHGGANYQGTVAGKRRKVTVTW